MFSNQDEAGGTPAFWEANWEDDRFEEALRFCEIDPLRRLLDQFVRSGGVVLEAGCGRGQWVAHLSARGIPVVGVDFARQTLSGLHRRRDHLALAAADVAHLPLRSGSVDLYFSIGVVEHFEAGPDVALAEAYRVLHPAGVALISVPYFNPLRRLLAGFGRANGQRVSEHIEGSDGVDQPFYQYVYTPKEFRKILGQHGFRVIDTMGYSILWGLYEVPIIGPRLPRADSDRRPTAHSASVSAANVTSRNDAPMSLRKRLAVSEDTSVPIAGLIVRVLRWAASNMMMYVCVQGGGQAQPASTGSGGR